jgi:uncharacterized membrane protein
MSKKKSPQKTVEDKREAKKAFVMGDQKKNPLVKFSVIALAILVIAGGAFFYFQKGGNNSPSTGFAASNASGTVVTHQASLFEDGKARHFSFAAGDGISVKYFILKSSDGIIRAAFDACDVCWPAGKGYYQSGDVMVCRNCGRQFPSVKVNEVKGGCNPAPLNRTVTDGNVVLQVADIMQGKTYFDFSRRS